MNRAPLLTSLVLAIAGASIFFYKHLELEMDLVPNPNARVWRVDISILLEGSDAAEGDESQARIELVLPASNRRQAILDEATFDDQFELTRVHNEDRRLAVWTGPIEGSRKLLYSLRVHLPSASSTSAGDSSQVSGFARITNPEPAHETPQHAQEFATLLERLGLETGDSPQAIIAAAFAFVVNEIELIDQANSDPLLFFEARGYDRRQASAASRTPGDRRTRCKFGIGPSPSHRGHDPCRVFRHRTDPQSRAPAAREGERAQPVPPEFHVALRGRPPLRPGDGRSFGTGRRDRIARIDPG